MEKKSTLVIGASENPERYSNQAVRLLLDYEHDVLALGVKEGSIGDVQILNKLPENLNIDTVTLYVNPSLQELYKSLILNLKPRRVIFNPGTENQEFEEMLSNNGIEPIEACTLVMLRTGQY
jgi:predicted CoA-binding protein